MTRQILIVALLGLGLSACGVGADEDLAALGLSLEQEAIAATHDPVPAPETDPASVVPVADQMGNIQVVAAASNAPPAPGDENGSSQDPIPPKIQRPGQTRQFR